MRLQSSNGMYLQKLGEETDPKKKLSLRSMISKNNAKINEYRAKLGTYKSMSPQAMQKKSLILKKTHEAIEANIAKGATISQALNLALAQMGLKPAQQQIIKQQVMQQVAAGTPMQYAVQQSIQENYQEQVVNTALSDNFTVENILDKL